MPFVAIAVLAIVVIPSSLAQDMEPQDWIGIRQAAEQAYRAEDAEAARELFASLTGKFPDDAEAWYGLSRAREWLGDLDGAIAAAERVQAIGYRSRASLAYRLAALHARAGNGSEALDWLERALEARYENRPGIRNDDAFRELRDDPRFRRLAGMLPERIRDRTSGLRFDIDYLVEEARRMHADPRRPAHSDAFRQAAGNLAASIPEKSDAEVFVDMMRLVAMLGDGHSAFYGPGPDSPLRLQAGLLPLTFYWFDEGLYVTHDHAAQGDLAGHRVIAFGGIPAESLLEQLAELRGVDNAMTWRWMGPQFYVGQAALLDAFGAMDDDGSVEVTLQSPRGETVVRRLIPAERPFRRKLRPPATVSDVPLYLSNVSDNYWMQPLGNGDTLYLQFNQVRDKDDEPIADFAASLTERLRDGKTTSLIVDVRHNNGGNNSLLTPLVNALIAFERADPDNQLFVITGRNTVSAAQNFINRVERSTNAVFVGEPSSSSPNFVGEETTLQLPWSRLFGSISTRYWQDSTPDDERPWIVPDIPVTPTAADYFAGRDAALEAILDYLRH